MRIRQRIFNELILRFNSHVISEVETLLWNEDSLICAFDELNFASIDTTENEWKYAVHQHGTLKTSFTLNKSVANLVNLDPLLESLINDPIILKFNVSAGFGESTEKAQVQLQKLQEKVGDEDITYDLYFSVDAYTAKKVTVSEVPEVWIGQAPDIGADHIDDYTKLT